MSIQTTLRAGLIEIVGRNQRKAYWGEEVSGIAPDIACLNGEFVLGLSADGNSTVPLIGVNSSNQVVLGNGNVAITAAHYPFNFDAATAVSRSVLIAPVAYQITGVQAVWGVASASGTLTIEKLTGTQAPGGGTVLLTGTISTAGAANTVATGVLIATLASLQFAAGDRLGLVFGGTETGLVGLDVTATFKRI